MSTPVDDRALALRILALPERERLELVRSLTRAQVDEMIGRWTVWAHDQQLLPGENWRIALIQAGRGFGKTRAGAEWVSQIARDRADARIALVGGTIDDVRRVMVEGESGLLSVARDGERLKWYRVRGELEFDNGAIAYVYSAAAPEALRGPQHHAAWCDELGKWREGARAWDNLMMGLRLGDHPQVLVTTTPRSTSLMHRVRATPGLVELRGRTRDNPHLSSGFVAAMEGDYAGTRLGRQELEGELIDEVAGALWTRAGLEACRVRGKRRPAGSRVVIGVDPPAGIGGDACGIVAVLLGQDGRAYVVEDASVAGLSPAGWARAVVRCARRNRADLVVAEVNNGGEMVRSVLHTVDPGLAIKAVRASHGKVARAEPVSALYDRGRVRHFGVFPELEDEMCGLSPDGYGGPGRSPDRADALVWALTELMLRRRRGVPAVRGF